jgi:hypothetical protein
MRASSSSALIHSLLCSRRASRLHAEHLHVDNPNPSLHDTFFRVIYKISNDLAQTPMTGFHTKAAD